MKIKAKKSSLVFVVGENEQTLALNVTTQFSGSVFPNPAQSSGASEGSGTFRGYFVDLEGLYAQGYRKVRFKATCAYYSKYTLGLISTDPLPTKNTSDTNIESYIPVSVRQTTYDYVELPITANSSYLHATYVYNVGSHADFEVANPTNGDAIASNYSI